MLLRKKLQKIGDTFFRFRSYIPFVLVVLFFIEKKHFHYPKGGFLFEEILEYMCFSVSLFGFLIRVIVTGYARTGTSGRNTKGQWAKELNTDGLYSIVRNPIYLGNIFIILGVSMLSQSYEIVLINFLFSICFYVPIIIREEEFLLQTFKEKFLNYAQCTPALLPNFKLWKRPELKFNFLRALYREHDTFIGLIFGFFSIEMLREYAINKRFYPEQPWTSIFIVALIIWGILKTLKKYLKSIDKGV